MKEWQVGIDAWYTGRVWAVQIARSNGVAVAHVFGATPDDAKSVASLVVDSVNAAIE